MMKKYLMTGVAALLFGVAVTSCSEDWNVQQNEKVEEFSNNFQNLVMGDLEINPNQTWSTADAATVEVSVDLDYDAEYSVYIYQSAPLVNPNAAFIGMTTLKSGETKTITVAKPADQTIFFAACYDKDSHATVKDFAINGTTGQVSFGEKISKARTRSVTTGHRWSVATKSMPDLTTYTTGELLEMKSEYNGNPMQADGTEKHLIISGNYSGEIARIQSYDKQSVYVTGTWTVPEDQRVTGGSVVVVGSTGKIVIPKGCLLSTNANNNENTTGMIYILPGGQIEGAGQLQFSNGTQTYSYNAGYINVADLNINGGILYNAGTIGNTTTPALTGPAGTPDNPSKFINLGTATLASTGGAGLSIENACNLTVTGTMAIGNSSKMDNGSYIECGNLELNGSNNGGIVLYMGENAYLKVKTKVNYINNFGLWGPDTNNGNYAFIDVPYNFNDRAINWTNDLPSTFCFDNVYAIISSDYEIADMKGDFQYNPRGFPASALLLTWMNGKKENNSVGEGVSDENLDGHTRSCYWAKSAPYTVTKSTDDNCGITINKGSDPDPGKKTEDGTPVSANWIYYAFEDLGGTNDFDFNDVVIRVSTPVNGQSTVQIMATGGELNSIVTYDGDEFGKEVHEALGTTSHTITNTGSIATIKTFPVLGTIPVSSTDNIADLPFGLKVLNSNGTVRNEIYTRGKLTASDSSNKKTYDNTPLYLVVNGDANGKWYWPQERVSIIRAFPSFTNWAAFVTDATWYTTSNATNNTVTTW